MARRSRRFSTQSGTADALVVRVRLPHDAAAVGGSKRRRGAKADAEDANGQRTVSRKPHYAALQKEEKAALLKEAQLLEAQAELLRQRAGMPSLRQCASVEEKGKENRRLREARRAQLLAMYGIRSVISQHVMDQGAVPLHLSICLKKDPEQRRAQLVSVRREKLDIAYRFLEERLRGVEPSRKYREELSWTSASGDLCASAAQIFVFEDRSVKQVFDAFKFYMVNMEISISEILGQLTLREDIEAVDSSISNHRLISSTDLGLLLELNSVSFEEYHEYYHDHHGEEFALYTADCVDDDELYPYCPEERVRKDIVGAVSFRPLRRQEGGKARMAVAMHRVAFLTIKKPEFEITSAAMDDLQRNVTVWGGVMVQSMSESLYGSGAS